MNKMLKKHLEEVSVEDLLEFRATQFIMYSSASGVNGLIRLGFDTNDRFIVKTRTEDFSFPMAHEAIEKYKELLTIKQESKHFVYTTSGYVEAIQYLISVGRFEDAQRNFSADGWSIVDFANSVKEKSQQ